MEGTFFLRRVREDDIRDVFELSNADYVRKFSINTHKIGWKEHVCWFKDVIKDETIVFYIATDSSGKFLGQLRYKIEDYSAIVSISLCKEASGKGLGYKFLSQSIKLISNERSEIEYIIAYIADKNSASKRLFEKVGFNFAENSKGLLKYIYAARKGEV